MNFEDVSAIHEMITQNVIADLRAKQDCEVSPSDLSFAVMAFGTFLQVNVILLSI